MLMVLRNLLQYNSEQSCHALEVLYINFFNNFSLILVLGQDVIAQAQSGTGKTATFAISILQKIDIGTNRTQALVIAPTRELAQQVCSLLLFLQCFKNFLKSKRFLSRN